MHEKITINQYKNATDRSKGQKILAAVYLVTQHLPETDPLKHHLRTVAIELVGASREGRALHIEKLLTIFGAAALSGSINEKNVAILTHEITLYGFDHDAERSIAAIFTPAPERQNFIKKTEQRHNSFSTSQITFDTKSNNNENKSKRQEQILSFINDRKSVGIKDISTLFTDVSEKTIQRELGTLVATGKITKRGSKRWSIYMAVS